MVYSHDDGKNEVAQSLKVFGNEPAPQSIKHEYENEVIFTEFGNSSSFENSFRIVNLHYSEIEPFEILIFHKQYGETDEYISDHIPGLLPSSWERIVVLAQQNMQNNTLVLTNLPSTIGLLKKHVRECGIKFYDGMHRFAAQRDPAVFRIMKNTKRALPEFPCNTEVSSQHFISIKHSLLAVH